MSFSQRKVIPACDWNGWWHYYCDLYDESPVFRDFLERRSTWYIIDNAIAKEQREQYFMPTDSACLEPKVNSRY